MPSEYKPLPYIKFLEYKALFQNLLTFFVSPMLIFGIWRYFHTCIWWPQKICLRSESKQMHLFCQKIKWTESSIFRFTCCWICIYIQIYCWFEEIALKLTYSQCRYSASLWAKILSLLSTLPCWSILWKMAGI